MKNVRVIARLDVKGPNVVKGVQFEALRVMGKPGTMAEEYFLQGADELIYLDIVASLYRRANLLHIVREASGHIHIPFTAGGGVRTIDDIRELLHSGADKIAINTAAIARPALIKEAAELFGSQCIVVSIEAKKTDLGWEAHTNNGREATGYDAVAWAREAEALGAGEILLTSVDREGTRRGLDHGLIEAVSRASTIPLIISGGTSSAADAAEAIASTGADSIAVATILHYGEANIADLKDAIGARGVGVRAVSAKERVRRMPKLDTDVLEYNRFTLRQLHDPRLVDIDPDPKHSTAESRIDPREADVCVINYEINNVRSVVAALERLGKKAVIVDTPEEVYAARRLVLPGVGAFAGGMEALRARGLIKPIVGQARAGVPLLGICLGMQLLFDESEEFGIHRGLGIIPGRVVSFPRPALAGDYKLPHIGWNSLSPGSHSWEKTLLGATKPGASVYFVHSFYAVPADSAAVIATSRYAGIDFCAVVGQGNISAAQFHPEKSGSVGLSMLAAFCGAGDSAIMSPQPAHERHLQVPKAPNRRGEI